MIIATGVALAAGLLAAGTIVSAQLETTSKDQQTKNQAVQDCYQIAKGQRVTSGSDEDGNWQLEQVDLNYEMIKKCVADKANS